MNCSAAVVARHAGVDVQPGWALGAKIFVQRVGRRRQHRRHPLATRRAAQPQEQTHVFESGDFARTRRTPLASNRPPSDGRDHRSRAEEEEEEEEKEEEKKEMSSTMVMVHPVPYGGETFLPCD